MEQFMQPDMGLKNIPEVIAENSLKDTTGFPYAGMWIFSGQQGSGKTLLMMHLVKKIITDYPKAKIVSNISIYGDSVHPVLRYRRFRAIQKRAGRRDLYHR